MALYAVKSTRQSIHCPKGCTGSLSRGFSRFFIADFRRTATMPSQRQYPMAVASGAVALDWKQRSLLRSWMDSQMYAFAPDALSVSNSCVCRIGGSRFPLGSLYTSISRARKVVARTAIQVVAVLRSPVTGTHRFTTRRRPKSQR